MTLQWLCAFICHVKEASFQIGDLTFQEVLVGLQTEPGMSFDDWNFTDGVSWWGTLGPIGEILLNEEWRVPEHIWDMTISGWAQKMQECIDVHSYVYFKTWT